MLSRTIRFRALEEALEDEIFHTHALRWRPVVKSLRPRDAERQKARYAQEGGRRTKLSPFWTSWQFVK